MRLKTTEEIKKESLEFMSKARSLDELHDKKELAEIRDRIQLNESCILYLRTYPAADYVSAVKKRLIERIKEIEADRYHVAKKELPKLKYQLRFHAHLID